MSQNQEIATQQDRPRDLRTILNGENMRKQFALALPKHLSAERFCRVSTTALMRVPNLAACTQESFMKCLLDLSAWGIEPDGRRAHLIPFKNNRTNVYECTLILDWKGLAELALRSGMIAKLHADLICDKDEFAYDMGEILHHKISFREPRGEPYAAYAMAETKDGAKFVQVMTKEEIEKIRDNSQGYRAFKKGWAKQSPWEDSPGEMWKKTVFRRLSKWLPLSAEFRDAADKEDDEPSLIRDVGPVALETAKPKFLTKPDPALEAPTDDEGPPVAGDTEAPQEPSQPTAEDEEGERQKLIEEVNELRDKSGYTMAEFKRRAAALGIVGAAEMLPKYSITALRTIKSRWEELRDA